MPVCRRRRLFSHVTSTTSTRGCFTSSRVTQEIIPCQARLLKETGKDKNGNIQRHLEHLHLA